MKSPQSSEQLTGVVDGWWAHPEQYCPEGSAFSGSYPGDSEEPADWVAECVDEQSDLRQGPFTAWWPNGKKREEGTFAGDDADGVWVQWNEAGTLGEKQRYKAGELIDEAGSETSNRGARLDIGTGFSMVNGKQTVVVTGSGEVREGGKAVFRLSPAGELSAVGAGGVFAKLGDGGRVEMKRKTTANPGPGKAAVLLDNGDIRISDMILAIRSDGVLRLGGQTVQFKGLTTANRRAAMFVGYIYAVQKLW